MMTIDVTGLAPHRTATATRKVMVRPKPKRFRVTDYDENGDIHAFEADSPESAKEREKAMAAQLKQVVCDVQRRV